MRLQTLDRLAIIAITILTVLISILLFNGDRTTPYIRDFSWHNQQVSATDQAFILTFSRPMNHKSVEQNLKIEPRLEGKFSWSGRRMAYTLTDSITYGQTYKLNLENAFDSFASELRSYTPIKPFNSDFSTPDPAFAYIGKTGDELGRLVVYDLTKNTKQILTPTDLTVLDYRIYSDRSKVLFSAVPKTTGFINPLDQKLYTVNLGNPNQLKLVLDTGDYQNLKFDLSADGKAIVVQRLSRVKIGNYGLWVIREGEEPKPLDNQPGGDFLIAPDSASVAISQGEGVAILPLQEGGTPLDFLPRFGTVLNFSQDGSEAVMVKFNKDYTRSLFRVTNQGGQEEIMKTTGSILDAQFGQQKQNLYGIFTDLKQTATSYQESLYIGEINLRTRQLQKIQDLPSWQRETKLSLAPDDTALLFEQSLKRSPNPLDEKTKIKFFPLPKFCDSPKPLNSIAQLTPDACLADGFSEILGTHPQWLP